MGYDGYYLSAYISICDLSYFSNIFIRHDQNMALWYRKDGKIQLIHYWEFERYTGLKHQYPSFYNLDQAVNIINNLLNEYGLTIKDMEAVWGTPELEIYSKIGNINIPNKNFSYHSYAHLFSSFLIDSNIFYSDTILAFEVDGGPDSAYDKGLYGNNLYIGSISNCGKVIDYFPISSPAQIWIRLKKITGLEEGTLMALGSACTCKLLNYELKIYDIFNYHDANKACNYFEDLYNKIIKLECDSNLISGMDYAFTERENKISMIVKVVTEFSLHIMEHNIEKAVEKYGIIPEETYLALSGGFALNCPINTKIMKKFKKNLIAPPCVNDSGLSLGIGLFGFYRIMDKLEFKLKNAYYGRKIKGNEIENILNDQKWNVFIKGISEFNSEIAAEDICESPIIWVNGGAEIGPRALGARSLIGDPRYENTKQRLNEIKLRQWWRPVAPIVMEEYLNLWFEDSYPSKYMLNTFYIKREIEWKVPAICHLDHSARVQTLKAEDNSQLYEVVLKFYEKTGIPIVCNTSLNDRGQPIINNIKDTIEFALKKKIRIAYINGLRFELYNFENYFPHVGFFNDIDFSIEPRLLQNIKENYNQIREFLSDEEIKVFIKDKNIFLNLNILNPSEALKVKRMQKAYRSLLESK